MLRSNIPTRAVLSVVPELRQVILRALHTGGPRSAPWTSTVSGPNRQPPPDAGGSLSFSGRSDERRGGRGQARRRDGAEIGSRGPPPAASFGLRSSPSSAAANGRMAPSSSKRLADLSDRNNLPPPARAPSKHAAFPSTAPAGKGRSKLDFMKSLPKPNISRTHSEVVSAKPHPFTNYPLNPAFLDILPNLLSADNGELMTTPIQSISLTRLLENPSDALLAAETGSGKTLAYMLPLLHHLKITDKYVGFPRDDSPPLPGVLGDLFGNANSASRGASSDQLLPRALVISPTHELTRQSTGVAKALGHGIKLSVVGMSSTKETAPGGGRKGVVDVLVGTSGGMRRMLGIKKDGEEEARRETAKERRLKKDDEEEDADEGLEMESRRRPTKGPRVGLSKVEWVVIDEADVLLGELLLLQEVRVI